MIIVDYHIFTVINSFLYR